MFFSEPGSGSTLVAAALSGCRYVGIELEDKHSQTSSASCEGPPLEAALYRDPVPAPAYVSPTLPVQETTQGGYNYRLTRKDKKTPRCALGSRKRPL